MISRVYLSLGSNVGDREANLRAAVDALDERAHVIRLSSSYETEPVGVTDQPPFLNLVVEMDTELEPPDLLRWLKEIEVRVGRRPTFRWGPRVVDIDILFYGNRVVASKDLEIPHREIANRAFVLVPLAEIAPDLVHPSLGRTVASIRDDVAGLETVKRVGDWVRG